MVESSENQEGPIENDFITYKRRVIELLLNDTYNSESRSLLNKV